MSKMIKFQKMHGLGNDFMMIETINQSVNISADIIAKLADRKLGIGFDQLLIVAPANKPEVDFQYLIYNADGKQVEHCGNGARCLARFVVENKLTEKDHIKVNCLAGDIELWLEQDGNVKVNMGQPKFAPEEIPFLEIHPNPPAKDFTLTPLFKNNGAIAGDIEILGAPQTFMTLSTGNPHCVIEVSSIANAPVDTLGKSICHHPQYPQGTNVEFMEIIDPKHIKLRVYERGCGETLACGTGACAAVVAGQLAGKLDQEVCVSLPGGDLVVNWQGNDQPIYMTGPANTVFSGEINLDNL